MRYNLSGKCIWVAGHNGMVGSAMRKLLVQKGYNNPNWLVCMCRTVVYDSSVFYELVHVFVQVQTFSIEMVCKSFFHPP